MKVDVINIAVDLTDTGRRLLHAVVDFPVQPNTTASFATPLWIQEHHSPTGPVPGISGLFFTAEAEGKTLAWRRNPLATAEYFVDIPSHVSTIQASFDAIVTRRVTRRMVALAWETVLLYPTDRPIEKMYIRASVTVPVQWGVGTALHPEGDAVVSASGAAKTFRYKPVTVERFEDSPLLTGLFFRQFALTPDESHLLCVAADEKEFSEVPEQNLTTLSNLVHEVLAITGVRHYRTHRFLLTLSKYAGVVGFEHAESFDGGLPLDALSDPNNFDDGIELTAHEYFHSWCGKYRRPCGHRPHDFQTPLDGRLLWVYEGLTQYYGEVLSVRSGGMSPEAYRTRLARTAATMDSQGGRQWRSIEDTGAGASLQANATWQNWQRGRGDYYSEGVLVWLTVDTIIRAHTSSQQSLDDWVKLFFGGSKDTGPKVVSYTLPDIVRSLESIVSYDWASFFRKNVQEVAPRALTEGIERAGYRLEYASEPVGDGRKPFLGKVNLLADAIWFSLGLKVDDEGNVLDVRKDGPSDKAGLGPTQSILKIGNSRVENALDHLAEEVRRASRERAPIRLTLHQEDDEWDLEIAYYHGLRCPRLARQMSKSDVLADILSARTKPHEPTQSRLL